MKSTFLRLAIVFAALFVIGACASNDNNEENNEPEEEENENENNNENEDEAESNNDEEENAAGNDYNRTEEGDRIVVDFEDITFSYPDDLEELDELEDVGMPAIGILIDEDSGTSLNIIAEPLPEEMDLTLDEYVELAMENSAGEYSKDQRNTVNDIDMHEFEGQQDDAVLRQRVFLHNGSAYAFTYGSLDEEALDEHASTFEEIIETIELN